MKFALVSLICFPLLAAAAAPPDLSWARLPEATVPLMKDGPVIDGTVDRREWQDATSLGLLAVDTDGVADGLRRRTFLGYTAERLYLGVQVERPVNALKPRTPDATGRVDMASGGDFFEVVLTPDRSLEKAVAFVLFPNGAFGDANLPKGGKEFLWNAESLLAAARLTPTGWEGELSVTWADLGRSGPPGPAEVWGFDAVDNRNTPATLLGHWAFRGGLWKNYQNTGSLRFAPAPALQIREFGQIGNQRLGADFSVLNTTGSAVPVKAMIELRKRKAGEAGGPKAFLENIESGMGHSTQVEFTKGVHLPDQVRFALNFYEPQGEIVEESTMIPPGEQRTFGFNRPVDLGEYLVLYRFASNDQILGAGSGVVRLQPPLPIRLEPYWLYSEVVDVVLSDLSRLEIPQGSSVRVELLKTADATQALAQTSSPVAAEEKTLTIPLPVKGIEPGGYFIRTTVTGADKTEIARADTPVERPPFPEWYRNDHGNKVAVPAPWTPVETSPQGTVRVWNRVYDLSTLLPKSILCGGDEILARPVSLDVTINGKPQTFVVDTFERKETSPAKAVFQARLTSADAELTGTATVEFDGFIWYDLTLAPRGQKLTLDKASLSAEIEPAFSELFGRHKFIEDPFLPAAKPVKNGVPGLLQDAQFPFTPLMWIGKEKGGLIVSVENMQDWVVKSPNEVMETTASVSGRPGRMEVHFVQEPVAFDKPRRWQFSLQGTPIREAMKDYRELAIRQFTGVEDNEEELRKTAEAGVKTVVFYYGWRGDPKTEMGGTPERPVTEAQREKLKRGVALAHKYGMKVIMFTGWGVNAVSPNWQKYGYELGKYPISNNGWGTYEQSAGLGGGYSDFMAWGHADLAREYGVDGVLYDSLTNLTPDSNVRIGNGWVDEKGRERPGYAVRATRDLVRRIYNIYNKEERPDGFIYNHCGSMWNLNAFADVINRGEGQPMSAPTLRAAWDPIEQYRAEYSGEPFGLIISNEQNDFKKLPMTVNNHNAVTLLHGTFPKVGRIPEKKDLGYERFKRPEPVLWRLCEWLPMDGTQKRHIYFEDQKGVVPANDKLLSSAFVSADGRRAIIVVSNLDKTPLENQAVRFDFKALGLAPGPYVVKDEILGETVPLEGDTVRLDILDERYRLLTIEAKGGN